MPTNPTCIYPCPESKAEAINIPRITAPLFPPPRVTLRIPQKTRLHIAVERTTPKAPNSILPVICPPTTAIPPLHILGTQPNLNSFANHHWAIPANHKAITMATLAPLTTPKIIVVIITIGCSILP